MIQRCDESRDSPSPQATSPAEAGPVLAQNRLLLTTRETETGEAKAKKRESSGFGN